MARTGQQEARLACILVAVAAWLGCKTAAPRHDVVPDVVRRPPSPTAPVLPSPTAVYVVHQGESLGQLARCSGTSVAALARANGLSEPNLLRAGTKLVLPANHHCGREDASAGAQRRARASHTLQQAEARLDAADFDEALALARACDDDLAAASDAKAKALRARCHVVAGIAATGLDRRDRAIAEFRRALDLDPKLELESQATSPRVRALMAEARTR
jgi:LysM repeat protein